MHHITKDKKSSLCYQCNLENRLISIEPKVWGNFEKKKHGYPFSKIYILVVHFKNALNLNNL